MLTPDEIQAMKPTPEQVKVYLRVLRASPYPDYVDEIGQHIDSLHRDKERLDWLQTQRLLIKNPDGHSLTRTYHPGGDDNPLRVAIDAAIAQERKDKQ